MRCNKCGYISFDYQTECKGCGASLAGVRDELGLPAAKPSLPFSLGSLTKEIKSKTGEMKGLVLDDSYDSTLPDIEFGDEFQGGPTAPAAPAAPPSTSSAARVSMEDLFAQSSPGAGKTEDFALDLDFLDEGQTPQGQAAKAAPASAGEKKVGQFIKEADLRPSAPPKAAGAADDNMVIEISDHDLENILEDLKDVPSDAPPPGKGGPKRS
jgi:hypothetical protein